MGTWASAPCLAMLEEYAGHVFPDEVDHTCPFPIGWLVGCIPNRPLYFYQKDIVELYVDILNPWTCSFC